MMKSKYSMTKTDYGYDYRGVAITRRSGGFTYGRITEFNHRTYPKTLKECIGDIDNYLDFVGATVERYRIKVGA